MGSWLFRKGTLGMGNRTCKVTIEHEELNIYISFCVKMASVLAEVEGPSRSRHTFTVQHSDAGMDYLSGPAQPLQLKHVISS